MKKRITPCSVTVERGRKANQPKHLGDLVEDHVYVWQELATLKMLRQRTSRPLREQLAHNPAMTM